MVAQVSSGGRANFPQVRDGVPWCAVVILGAGTAGTMTANRLRRRLAPEEWRITVVDQDDQDDQDDQHTYQPGYLLLPFGTYSAKQLTRSRHASLPDHVDFVVAEVDTVDPVSKTVRLVDGRNLTYDYLVIASGATPRPDQTPGMLGPEWRRSIFDFYTLDGAVALGEALKKFDHGRLVVHIAEMPIKCPVAPMRRSTWARRCCQSCSSPTGSRSREHSL